MIIQNADLANAVATIVKLLKRELEFNGYKIRCTTSTPTVRIYPDGNDLIVHIHDGQIEVDALPFLRLLTPVMRKVRLKVDGDQVITEER